MFQWAALLNKGWIILKLCLVFFFFFQSKLFRTKNCDDKTVLSFLGINMQRVHIKDVHWLFLHLSLKLLRHRVVCSNVSVTRTSLWLQVVREDKKKVIHFASELKKLTSRSRSMATGGGVDGPAQSKDDRAACCVALTELQEWGCTLPAVCAWTATEVAYVVSDTWHYKGSIFNANCAWGYVLRNILYMQVLLKHET